MTWWENLDVCDACDSLLTRQWRKGHRAELRRAFWRGFLDGASLGPLRRWLRERRGGAR